MRTLVLAAFLVLAPAAHAQDESQLVLELLLDAPIEEVWSAYTTPAGLQSWMAAHADVDLTVGGKVLTHFDPRGKLGDAQTLEDRILAFHPMRMLSLKSEKVPADMPFQAAAKNLWSVIYFTPEADRTRVAMVTLGFGADEESKKLRAFISSGNDYLAQQLRKRFARPAATQSR